MTQINLSFVLKLRYLKTVRVKKRLKISCQVMLSYLVKLGLNGQMGDSLAQEKLGNVVCPF